MIKVTDMIPRESDKIMSHRKEDSLDFELAILDPRDGASIVTCRVYWPGTVAYACIWIHGDSCYARGAGKAAGGGYCKASAAIDSAICDAGFKLSESVAGRGEQAAREALLAVARAVTGRRKFFIHRAHG